MNDGFLQPRVGHVWAINIGVADDSGDKSRESSTNFFFLTLSSHGRHDTARDVRGQKNARKRGSRS